jgi:lathosterol oxidase
VSAAGMTVPLEMLVIHGHSRVYHEVEEHGLPYLILSPILFIFFTDCLIYVIHRGLHWGMRQLVPCVDHVCCFTAWVCRSGPLYGPIHKLHHRFKNTTPFSAFSFHPIDGWLQGVLCSSTACCVARAHNRVLAAAGLPYHLFVFVFPMHNIMYSLSVFVVSLWTVSESTVLHWPCVSRLIFDFDVADIHDRVSLRLPGVNGAAHHTVHHTKFNFNYGQVHSVQLLRDELSMLLVVLSCSISFSGTGF